MSLPPESAESAESAEDRELPDGRNWPLMLGVVAVVLLVLVGLAYLTFSWTLKTTLASPPCSAAATDLSSQLAATPVLAQLPADAGKVGHYVRCGDGAGDAPGTAVFTGTSFHTAQSRSALVDALEKSSDLGTWRRGLHGTLDGTTPQDIKNVAFVETTAAGRGICVSLFQDAPQEFRLQLSASTVADVFCPGVTVHRTISDLPLEK